jgi:peptidoglycan/LPS O-acetylase OafA/YrhL
MDTTAIRPKPHLVQVDYVRAIASLGVTLFHIGGKTLPVLNYGWLGVEMFFLLSGFIICWSLPDKYSWRMIGKFISKRIIRIEPPYLVSVIMALFINLVWVKGEHPKLFDILCHIAYVNNFTGRPYLSPVYWTLGIEFQYYIFIALCFPLLIKKWSAWLLLALCIIPIYSPLPGSTLAAVFPLFALGILYYLYLKRIKKYPELLVFGILISAISVITIGWLPTAAGLFTLGLLMLPLRGSRIIAFFSKISFSLYLTHDLIGSNWVVYLGSILPKTFFCKALEFSTGFIISILFAYLFYKLIESPSLNLSKRIRYFS